MDIRSERELVRRIRYEPDHDKKWLLWAYHVATHSPDPSTHNGAVVVDHTGEKIASACNDMTDGVEAIAERLERPAKYLWIEHAERAALHKAHLLSRRRVHKIYSPWAACADCARAISASGIKFMVRHKEAMEMAGELGGRWTESVRVGDEILRANQVRIVEWSGVLGVEVLRDGKVVGL